MILYWTGGSEGVELKSYTPEHLTEMWSAHLL